MDDQVLRARERNARAAEIDEDRSVDRLSFVVGGGEDEVDAEASGPMTRRVDEGLLGEAQRILWKGLQTETSSQRVRGRGH
jgi:hypothetical protein